MADDKCSSIDHVEAGISTVATAPEHPCPLCGKAMKDASTEESLKAGQQLRICSSPACRAKADWSSGSGVLINN